MNKQIISKTQWFTDQDDPKAELQKRLEFRRIKDRVIVSLEVYRREFTEACISSALYELSIAELYGMSLLIKEDEK